MKGLVFNIQRFSTADGPGIRTTVFLKGCNLRCKWCHNADGLENRINLQFIDNKCIYCKECERVCHQGVHEFNGRHIVHFDKCISCFECCDVCAPKALTRNGEYYDSDELVQILLRDKEFYENGGGVTFSGGEPLLQHEFIKEVANRLKKENIHVAVDTAGNVKKEIFDELNDYVDLYLYDIKAATEKLHITGTSVSNENIIKNLYYLDSINKPLWIRIPVIGGFNDTEDEIIKIHNIISKLHNVQKVNLISFHKLGLEKYKSLGIETEMDKYYEIDEEIIKQFERRMC